MGAAPDIQAARLAAMIGDPARSRMLFRLMDHRARTSTELALVAGVSPSTASAHLKQLEAQRLVRVVPQGKHRYYSLAGSAVAGVLEALSRLAGSPQQPFQPTAPDRLRAARTCYDHLAGSLGVAVFDRLATLGWLDAGDARKGDRDVTSKGAKGFWSLGVYVDAVRCQRRRFAYECLDWSERRPHLGGALAAALLDSFVARRWVKPERDGRAVAVTALGRRELAARLGVKTGG